MTVDGHTSLLGDVPFEISVELGRRNMSLRELLHLRANSVVTLSRSAGENIDILIGGETIGFGEIVVIDNRTGIRITAFNAER